MVLEQDFRAFCDDYGLFSCGTSEQYQKAFALCHASKVSEDLGIDGTKYASYLAVALWLCSDDIGLSEAFDMIEEIII